MIAAAGTGQRLGAGGPKAFVELAGRPMLEWSLDAFRGAARSRRSWSRLRPGSQERAAEQGVVAVAGGEHRSESVAKALALCGGEIVVVHDAARPLVTPGLIDAVVAGARRRGGRRGGDRRVPGHRHDQAGTGRGRSSAPWTAPALWAVQTPQAFSADALREALADPDSLPDASDDAMLVERRGGRVLIHSTSPDNLKVTTPFDLRVAELLLRERA